MRVRAEADLREAQVLGFVGLALVSLGTALSLWDLTLKRAWILIGGPAIAVIVFGAAALWRRRRLR